MLVSHSYSRFEMIYSEKAKLLELYNAMHHTNYDDPEMLEINTLKNAIYMSMYNDVSFIIDSRLNLYEHQSMVNPNLPLRSLMYAADLYSVIAKDHNLSPSGACVIALRRNVTIIHRTWLGKL